MEKILVLGLYEDTGQTFAHLAETGDRQEALRAAAEEAGTAADQLIILGTVGADLELVTPGDENDNGTYASDLLEALDEDAV